MANKWKLQLQDNTEIDIPPHLVESVRNKIVSKEPLNLRTRVVPFSQIQKFYQTEESDTPLLGDASHVFNEPVINDDGSIATAWVKKSVPSDKWSSHYAKMSHYCRLEELGGTSVIAFKLPLHQINQKRVNYCTDSEVKELERID